MTGLARNLLLLLTLAALVQGLLPDFPVREREMALAWTARGPGALPWLQFAALASYLVGIALAGVPLLWPLPARYGFVAGLAISGVGIVATSMATTFPAVVSGRIFADAGLWLFGASTFVLQAENVPRRWLLAGPSLYFVVHGLAEYARRFLPEGTAPPLTVPLIGGLALLLLGAAASMLLCDAVTPPEASGTISRQSVWRLFALTALMMLGQAFLVRGTAAGSTVALDLVWGQDPWDLIEIVVRDVLPVAILAALLIRGVSISRAGRGLSVLIVGSIALAWAVPVLRWPAQSFIGELLPVTLSILTIALARGVSPRWRLPVAYGFAVGAWALRWSGDVILAARYALNPKLGGQAYPIGLTISLGMVLLAATWFLFAPQSADEPPRPGSPRNPIG